MLPITAVSDAQTTSLAKRPTPARSTESVRRMSTTATLKADSTATTPTVQPQAQDQTTAPHHQQKPIAYSGKPLPQIPPGWMKQHKRTIRDFDGACLDFLKLPQVKNLLDTSTSGSQNGKAPTRTQTGDVATPNNLRSHRNLSISDPNISGQPIQLRSRHFSLGPRGMSVGACQFVNLPQSANAIKPQLHLSTRPGPDSRPTFVLEYATPLISEETGEVAYIFAATVDVTLFVREQVARLLATDEDYAEIDALGHAPRRRRASRRKSIQIQQKDSGVFIDPARNFSRRDLSVKASAEKMYASGPEVRIQRHDDSHNDGYESQEKGNADEGDDHESKIDWLLLDDFPVPPVTDRLPALPGNVETALQQLFAHAVTQHRHAFLLTSTATLRSSSSHKAQSGQWLVSYTSPALHKRRKDLAVALSKTEEGVLREVGEMLAGDRDVSTQIAWGVAGERRLLKAVPMMRDGRAGGGVACWLCFLLDI